jgi:hypothetical protein
VNNARRAAAADDAVLTFEAADKAGFVTAGQRAVFNEAKESPEAVIKAAEVGYLAALVTEFGGFVTGEDTWSPTVLDSGIDRLVYQRHGRVYQITLEDVTEVAWPEGYEPNGSGEATA